MHHVLFLGVGARSGVRRLVEAQLVLQVRETGLEFVALVEDVLELGEGEAWPVRVVALVDQLGGEVARLVLGGSTEKCEFLFQLDYGTEISNTREFLFRGSVRNTLKMEGHSAQKKD